VAAFLALTLVPVANAASAEEQPLQAIPTYTNPLTMEIEDTGNNPGLGQGMVENLVKKTPATLLTDAEGSLFITFRVGLVLESQDFRIELLDNEGAVKEAVPYSIVAEQPDENTRDLRIKVPSQNSILRISLVSIPMGREVVGFLAFAPEGEAVAVPLAEQEVDDSAISIYENANNDEVKGVDEQTRGSLLLFLGVAAGTLLVIGSVAGIVYLRKKKSGESA
jgi:ABC-type antimicrobial peptide transport system permease subunit